jgi:hypothetical protein
MDIDKVLAQLHAELANLNAAILSLEKLQQEARPRGRPKGSGRRKDVARETEKADVEPEPQP